MTALQLESTIQGKYKKKIMLLVGSKLFPKKKGRRYLSYHLLASIILCPSSTHFLRILNLKKRNQKQDLVERKDSNGEKKNLFLSIMY